MMYVMMIGEEEGSLMERIAICDGWRRREEAP